MHIQKKLVLALYGISCTGKSSVARILSKLCDCSLRSAGDAVRARCQELNISVDRLSLEEHRSIDGSTRAMAKGVNERVVLEGTFLDALLANIENIYRIELTCEDQERRTRYEVREHHDGLHLRDAADQELRYLLHNHCGGLADITIDTTQKTPDEVAKEIMAWIQIRDQNEELG